MTVPTRDEHLRFVLDRAHLLTLAAAYNSLPPARMHGDDPAIHAELEKLAGGPVPSEDWTFLCMQVAMLAAAQQSGDAVGECRARSHLDDAVRSILCSRTAA